MRTPITTLQTSNQKNLALSFMSFLRSLWRSIMNIFSSSVKPLADPPTAATVVIAVKPRAPLKVGCVTIITIDTDETLSSVNWNFGVTIKFSPTHSYTIPSDATVAFDAMAVTYTISGVAVTFSSTPPATVTLKLGTTTQSGVPLDYTKDSKC